MLRSVYSFNLGSALKRGLRSTTSQVSMISGVSVTNPIKLTGQSAGKALLDKTDCFIFDCDGVIWKGIVIEQLYNK